MTLAPLAPDAFLSWFWSHHGGKGRVPTWREWCLMVGETPRRKTVVRWAAETRYWQRLGVYHRIHGGRRKPFNLDAWKRANAWLLED